METINLKLDCTEFKGTDSKDITGYVIGNIIDEWCDTCFYLDDTVLYINEHVKYLDKELQHFSNSLSLLNKQKKLKE